MFRIVFLCTVLAAFVSPVRAERTLTDTEWLIRLSVQPMAAPKPALRYLLLPELKEMTPGNPIPNYLKCFMEQRDFMPGGETLSKAALRQADRAARLDKPDWQILLKLRTDGVGLLLPDLQNMRFLTLELRNRFHDEVVRGRFDDALRTAKTMFALSRHMGEHPTLIGDLVGMSLAQITIYTLEEMLEQPGCPNLYWALTNLPDPLISVSKGLEGERVMISAELRDLNDRESMSPGQIKKLIAHIDKLRQLEGGSGQSKENTRTWLNARTKDEKAVEAARHRLVEYGIAEERLAKFPADQVILLDEKQKSEIHRDEEMKLTNLPTWEIVALTAQDKPAKEPALFDFLVPAMQKVHQAQGRSKRFIALLRHVEALRLYAAEHEGKLPEKLSDIDVPLPVDPFTGKPFLYKREGETTHLRGRPPRGYEKFPYLNIHYEITIRK
ncbi:MAG TPA: hypothetical protein VH682_04400 [Gemmataceae bacterium]|jgi:hypothetical protein